MRPKTIMNEPTNPLPQTRLDYLQNTYQFEATAKLLGVSSDEHGLFLVFDQTIFYPQGGGQPWDLGTITVGDQSYPVNAVGYKDGIVCHRGAFAGAKLNVGDSVILRIDPERRRLNARLHTAGHLIQAAFNELYPNVKPLKGHHYPDGPYVEFLTPMEIPETMASRLEALVNEKVRQGVSVTQEATTYEFIVRNAAFVPSNLPRDKPLRIVVIGHYAPLPCGGTHVQSTKEIGEVRIRKMKTKDGVLRVSYNL